MHVFYASFARSAAFLAFLASLTVRYCFKAARYMACSRGSFETGSIGLGFDESEDEMRARFSAGMPAGTSDGFAAGGFLGEMPVGTSDGFAAGGFSAGMSAGGFLGEMPVGTSDGFAAGGFLGGMPTGPIGSMNGYAERGS